MIDDSWSCKCWQYNDRGNNIKNQYIFSLKAWNKEDSSYEVFIFSISHAQFSKSF